ncbi:hypothetical protein EUTSA_v10003018mg [Eutrema salsugineum]|uniref:RING-type domain-containing protein n=1 Tax=Eutrema salsugineum TaxID=72664 RepID=V4L1K1_EUTSA|nr:uncharacterized RING finger protein YBR062C [Eutrema salsugineum]ESQ37499.1 hypothetical protein EUTSA_v10003018mg [Eutrema salsugineum]
METAAVSVDVFARAFSQDPSLGFLSTAVISLNREFEEFLVDENGGNVSSLGSYPASNSRPDREISLKLQNFTPNHIYKHLQNRFHDHVLSRQICDRMVVEAEKQSQSVPLSMVVSVKLTQKVFIVVPCNSTTDFETESCVICFENLSESESETKPICELPNCPHRFHEECFLEWYLDRQNNSCPLCRQSIY